MTRTLAVCAEMLHLDLSFGRAAIAVLRRSPMV
jgi:hypothetical protein